MTRLYMWKPWEIKSFDTIWLLLFGCCYPFVGFGSGNEVCTCQWKRQSSSTLQLAHARSSQAIEPPNPQAEAEVRTWMGYGRLSHVWLCHLVHIIEKPIVENLQDAGDMLCMFCVAYFTCTSYKCIRPFSSFIVVWSLMAVKWVVEFL